jgi:regulator of RNase E activity RraA
MDAKVEYQPVAMETLQALQSVSTAALTVALLKTGLRNCFIRGANPTYSASQRVVGPAFTLRFVSSREDLYSPRSASSRKSTQAALEEVPKGAIVVIGALNVVDAGVVGDISCARLRRLEAAAIITDGVVRDSVGVGQTGLPVWCRGAAAAPSGTSLAGVGSQEVIDCGGVAVFPNDVIVADQDGAVVIPREMLASISAMATDLELLDAWVLDHVNRGASLLGLYPPDDETRKRFDEFRLANRECGDASQVRHSV